MRVLEEIRVNLVAQMVLGDVSGSTQSGSTLCTPYATSKETSCNIHMTIVSWNSPAVPVRFALVTYCTGLAPQTLGPVM